LYISWLGQSTVCGRAFSSVILRSPNEFGRPRISRRRPEYNYRFERAEEPVVLQGRLREEEEPRNSGQAPAGILRRSDPGRRVGLAPILHPSAGCITASSG